MTLQQLHSKRISVKAILVAALSTIIILSSNSNNNIPYRIAAAERVEAMALFSRLFITFSAHNGESNSNVSEITFEQRAKIEQAGVLHDKMLDAILSDIWQERGRLLTEYSDAGLIPIYPIYSSYKPHLHQSAINIEMNIEQVAYNTIQRLMKEWKLVQSEEDKMAISMLKQQIDSVNATNALQEQFTPFQAEYFSRLMNIFLMDNNTTSLNRLLSKIARLELQIEQNAPTVKEALPLLYTANIVRHSVQYWSRNNRMRWVTALYSRVVGKLEFDIDYQLDEAVAQTNFEKEEEE